MRWGRGGEDGLPQRSSTLHYTQSVPGLNPPKVVRPEDFLCFLFFFFFLRQKDASFCPLSTCAPRQCHLLWELHTAFDSRAHPCTVTLGGEVEQGRVNDAARVGRSADLVTAPLFLLDFCLSQLLLLWFFLV